MKTLLRAGFILLLSFSAFAEEEQVPLEKIEKYMELCGINEMIDGMPMQINASLNQRLLTAKDPEAEKEVAQILSDAWQTDEIHSTVAQYLQTNASEGEIDGLLEWRQDTLFIKITEAEKEASSPNFQSEFLRYISELQQTPPEQARTETIRRLVDATDMADLMVETAVQVTRAMSTAILGAQEIGAPDEMLAEMDQQIDTMRNMLGPQMEQQAMLVSYYIYRDMSNEELDSYSAFYESDLGKRELELLYQSLGLAMTHWASQSAEGIVKTLEQTEA